MFASLDDMVATSATKSSMLNVRETANYNI